MRRDQAMLLDEILEMSLRELREFIKCECQERGMEFDEDDLDGSGRQAYYDYIATHLYTSQEFQSALHSEFQIKPGDPMNPNAETEEDLEEEFEHSMNRD